MAQTDAQGGRPAPLFGISFAPQARDPQHAFALTRLADETGIDLVTIQDHPYNAGFLDTWTLLAALGGRTERVRLMGNVLNLPLRPPAMLAKEAASLDVLTGGRLEMGLGAGAFWDGIAAWGGPRRTPGEAVEALEEAIQVMRALWEPEPAGPVSFAGRHYHLEGAQPGPAPAHRIGIWLGVNGPRMLGVTGRLADGWIVSAAYVPPEAVPERQALIDAAADAAGRPRAAIRRAYNVGGVLLGTGDPAPTPRRPGLLVGEAGRWIEALAGYYRDLRLDTFIFWPAGPGAEEQVRRFAEEVIPGMRRAVGA